MSTPRLRIQGAIALAALFAFAPSLHAQGISTSSPRGLGMDGAYGAVARGASAGLLNPAMLGLDDNPSFTLLLAAVAIDAGSSPIGWRDIGAYSGKLVPDDVKRAWLAQIPAGGTFRLGADASIQPFGLSIGPVAFNLIGLAGGSAKLPRDAVSLLLFGNADSSDKGGVYNLDHGTAAGFAVTSADLSAGFRIWRVGDGDLSLGVTAKMVVGIAFAGLPATQGSVSGTPPAGDIRFPAVVIDNTSHPFDHKGYGVDAGLAWQTEGLTLGFAVSDIVNTFRWQEADAQLRDGRVLFNSTSATSSFANKTLNDGSLEPSVATNARALLDQARFRPSFRGSAAFALSPDLVLSADAVHTVGGLTGSDLGSWSHGAAGTEWRWFGGLFPLRGGLGLSTDGAFDWSAGTGLDFAAFSLNVAYAEVRAFGGGTVSRLGVGIGFGRGR